MQQQGSFQQENPYQYNPFLGTNQNMFTPNNMQPPTYRQQPLVAASSVGHVNVLDTGHPNVFPSLSVI